MASKTQAMGPVMMLRGRRRKSVRKQEGLAHEDCLPKSIRRTSSSRSFSNPSTTSTQPSKQTIKQSELYQTLHTFITSLPSLPKQSPCNSKHSSPSSPSPPWPPQAHSRLELAKHARSTRRPSAANSTNCNYSASCLSTWASTVSMSLWSISAAAEILPSAAKVEPRYVSSIFLPRFKRMF